jgi:hypothetical protein
MYVCFHLYYQNQLVRNSSHNELHKTPVTKHVSVWIHAIFRGTIEHLKHFKITLAWLFNELLWSLVHGDLNYVRVGSDNIYYKHIPHIY